MIDRGVPDGARLSSADVIPLCVLATTTLLRTLPFLAFARFHFDSDQAVFGLMAIDLAHLRAAPLVLYGQSYLLGVIAWLAAPLFAVFGPSVELLKAPFIPINLAYVFILYALLRSSARLSRTSACLVTALTALPTTVVASSFMNASGGHVEPLLYVVLLYLLRKKRVALPLVAAFAVVHREYMIAAVVALMVIDLLQLDDIRRFARTWLLFGIIGAAGVMAMRSAVRHFASNYRQSAPVYELTTNVPESLGWLWTHTSAILGLQRTDVHNLGLALPHLEGSMVFAAALGVLGGLALFTLVEARAWRRRLPPEQGLGAYLVLTSLLAAAAFAGKRLEHDPTLLRYLFLLLLLPPGLAAMSLGWSTRKGIRLATGAAAGVLLAANLYSNAQYIQELRTAHLVDVDGEIVASMSDRGLHYGLAPYWTAYKLAFRSGGVMHVASSDVVRIPEYQVDYRTHPRQGFRIGGGPCANGSVRLRNLEICLDEPAR